MAWIVRADYSPFRPNVIEKQFVTFLAAWWWSKKWIWKHPFSLAIIEKV
jgi:hypothetical protein